jgi:acetyl esterase/lipase
VAATAGREIETSFKAPALRKQPVAPVTTGELLSTKAAAPAAASNAAAVQNSLTYTPGPALQDQITLGFLHILRALSDLTGVDLFFKVNSLLVSNAPPAILTLGLDTRQTTYTTDDGTKWKVWEFHPPNPTGRTVIALHGGGFITQPNLLHWIDYTTMARDTGATVIVPLYPLATTDAGRPTVVVPDMADFISSQIEASGGAQNVSVYADSAGSTYAMGAVRQLLLDGKPVPSSMVLLSLSADFSSSNPDILKVYDPIFNIKNLSSYDSHFTDGIPDVQHSLISPLFYEPEILEHMPPTTIYVGQSEILYPDTLLLHEQAVLDNAPISVVVGTGLPHDWPSGGIPQYSQVAVVRPDIYRQLGLTHAAPRRPTLHAITGK